MKRKGLIAASVVVLLVISVLIFNRTKEEEKIPTEIKSTNFTVKQEKGGVSLTGSKGKIEIELCREDILKLHHSLNGKITENTAVIDKKQWQEVKAEYNLEAEPAIIRTAKMTIKLDKNTGNVSVEDSQGKLLIKEFSINSAEDKRYKEAVLLQYEGDNTFYGMSGYAASDSHKGITREEEYYAVMAGAQGYSGGPFIWTNSGYGLLVDSDGGEFNLDKEKKEVYYVNSSREDKEAYLMVGSPVEIMGHLAEVTGKTPMFPKWSTGFTNSQWGLTEEKLLNIIKTYRSKNIPIDNFTLDFDWKAWGEDEYGEFRWNTANFPGGESGEMAKKLMESGIKLTGILKPRIHVDTKQGRFITEKNWWLESKGFMEDYFSGKQIGDLDFSKEEVRKWYYEMMIPAYKSGFVGWWNDEADELSPNLQHLNMQRALYEGQRAIDNYRVWSLNRNFYVGAQRFAYGMWSGDINTGFYPMQGQRDRMLSAVTLGQTKWGMDTGGFHGTPSDENYARWMQFSALTPIFRVHGGLGEARQPWLYGDKAEKAAAEAVRLRYKLIPYVYSYERKAYDTGVGLVKPLIFDYPYDKNIENYVEAWMFGDYILVSPVMEEGAESTRIYLPKGKWIDYQKGTVYEGGDFIDYKVDSTNWLDIPMFIKEGAIIPSQEVMNYVGEKPVDKIYVDIFPSENSTEFKYYDDDGKTYEYEQGKYFSQNLYQKLDGTEVKINISKAEGSYKPETSFYILKVHGKSSSTLTVNGSEIMKATGEKELLDSTEEVVAFGKDIYGDYTIIKLRVGEEKEIKLN